MDDPGGKNMTNIASAETMTPLGLDTYIIDIIVHTKLITVMPLTKSITSIRLRF